MASFELEQESLGMDACVGVHQAQTIEHLNTQWVIGLVQSGGGEVKVRRESLALAPGDCLIVPPGVTSLTHWQVDSQVATLFFWPERLEAELPTRALPRA